jgi:hypothetical protein
MWQRNIPPIIWRDEMLDLQITVDADGTLYLPENVVVIPPPRKHWRARTLVPWNAAFFQNGRR